MLSLDKYFLFFAVLFMSNQLNASALDKNMQGQFSILGSNVAWNAEGDKLSIKVRNMPRKFRVQFANGKERIISPPAVDALHKSQWEPSKLIRQIGLDTQSPIANVEKVSEASSGDLALSAKLISSWRSIDDVPVSVRAVLRVQLKTFIKTHERQLRQSIEKVLKAEGSRKSLPRFLQCLLLPHGNDDAAKTTSSSFVYKEDLVEPCLGLISPSTSVLADSLVNTPAPLPIRKMYFSQKDPSRPLWNKPTFIIVHASKDFHYPAIMKTALNKRIKDFREKERKVVFLIHNDNFNDASYFVNPTVADLAFYSETGKHPLCENCQDVTFAGGFIDWCLSLAIRSYIANYFRIHETGEIRINLAADSIYTEAKGPSGTEGAITALAEIQKDGERSFIRKRLGQYLSGPKLKDVGQALCWVSDKKNDLCTSAAAGVVLSEIDGSDNDGKFYPFFDDKRFKFHIQVNGNDIVQTLGDSVSQKTITFNILTE